MDPHADGLQGRGYNRSRPRAALHYLALLTTFCLLAGLTASQPKDKPADPNVDYFTCTMHPSVHLQDPHAKCPVCGMTIVTTVEGRERYPISVRYARDFRDDLDTLKRVLVATPMTGGGRAGEGAVAKGTPAPPPALPEVPISLLADISFKTGPPSIRNENGLLVGFVFVDITAGNLEGYVREASQRISVRVKFPSGY